MSEEIIEHDQHSIGTDETAEAMERHEAAVEEITSVLGIEPGAHNPDHRMGLFGAISFVCGSVIGSGIFISPSTILKETNSVGLSLSIWVLSSLISAMGCLCYIEMGTSIKKSGSDFAYMHYMKLYPLAFAFGIVTCFVTHTSTLAIQALTFAEYLRQGIGLKVADAHQAYLLNVGISFSTVALLAVLNFYSIKTVVSRFQIVASFAKIASTLLIICVGGYFLICKEQYQNLQDPFKNSQYSAGNLVSAFFAGLLAYDGWDVLNMGTEEIRNPRRNMPLAIGMGMSLITILFTLTNIAYSVILTTVEIQESDAVAMKFADKAMGQFGFIVPFMICIVLIGSLNSTLFLGSRALHAISRSGLLPQFLSCWSHKRGSPRVAIIAHVLAALFMALSFDVRQLINYKGFSAWTQRTITIILLLYIRLTNTPVDPQRIRTPLFMPFLFIICTSALVITTIVGQTKTALVVIGILSVGFLTYAVFVWEKALPRCRFYANCLAKLNAILNKLCEVVFHGQIDIQHQKTAKNKQKVADMGAENKINIQVFDNGTTAFQINGKQLD